MSINEYVFNSSSFINTPRLFMWLRSGYPAALEADKPNHCRVISEGYGVTEDIARKILEGKGQLEYKYDEGKVVWKDE